MKLGEFPWCMVRRATKDCKAITCQASGPGMVITRMVIPALPKHSFTGEKKNLYIEGSRIDGLYSGGRVHGLLAMASFIDSGRGRGLVMRSGP